MNLNRDPESWAKVRLDLIAVGSIAQACNVLEMALQDIARLAAEYTHEVARRRETEAEAAWLRRLVQWCRPRMRRYGKTLDGYLAAGPTDAPNDPPIAAAVDRQGGSHDASPPIVE